MTSARAAVAGDSHSLPSWIRLYREILLHRTIRHHVRSDLQIRLLLVAGATLGKQPASFNRSRFHSFSLLISSWEDSEFSPAPGFPFFFPEPDPSVLPFRLHAALLLRLQDKREELKKKKKKARGKKKLVLSL